MASGISNFTFNLMLEKLLRGTAGTWPATIYLALFTATPSDTGGGTEYTGFGSRLACTVGSSLFNALSGGSTSNTSTLTLTSSATTGSGGSNVTQFGFYDASTSGNLLMWADITTPQPVSAGNSISFAAGALVVGGI